MKSRHFMGFRFFGFALQMLRRDFYAGELRLLVAALIVSVAAMTAVGFFTDRVRQALAREANQLLGADLLLISDHPWSDATRATIASSGLQTAETQTFPSMVMAGRQEGGMRTQLAEVKAVSSAYPLRGRLRIAPSVHEADAPADGTPARGTAWIDERLASALSVGVGDSVDVGERQLTVAAILTFEPDRGVNFFSVAPRLLISLDDLDATGLVQQGSRVGYRLLVAGEEKRVKVLRSIVGAGLGRGERIEDAENARPEIRTALERAQKFLGIAAMLSVVLAAVAIALASRRYVQRHLDPCAIMRCLGATQSFLLGIYVTQFALLACVSTAFGCLIGYAAHFVLHAGLAHLLASTLPLPGAMPALQGVLVGFVLLFGFSLPPVWQLKRVSTLRVLRREFIAGGLPPGRLLLGYGAGFLGLAGLIVWMAGDRALGGIIVLGFVGAMLVFALVARLCVFLLSRLRGGSVGRVGWRFGLASLERHALASVVQIVALALGLMALFLLTAIRGDLLAAWQRAVPVDAPNRFVINIQPEQLAGVRESFVRHRLAPVFSPMIRGRLTSINGVAVGPEKYEDERAKRLVDREFNLSYQADLPAGNRVTAGRWFDRRDSGRGVASVEEGLAKTLGLKLGDRLEFTIAGERVDVEVVGLRKLNWDSMRVNFFVLTPPKVLDDFPTSWITSFYLAPERSDVVNALVSAFPNLTVIDVAAIVRQLQAIIDQVAQAVQFVFLFALAAGVIVLYAALASAAQERRYELAVMRALGARRVQLRTAMSAEFAAIGGLAGLVGALGAIIVGQVLALRAFQLEVPVAYWLLPVGVVAGALLVTGVGWLAVTRLTSAPPLATLRAGG